MNTTYKHIFKAATLFGGVHGLNILLNLIRTKCVAVLLGPSGVGLNSIYNETRELLHTTTNIGLDLSGVRGISQVYEKWSNSTSDEERNKLQKDINFQIQLLRSWVFILALAGILVCMLFASPISYFTFGNYDHTWSYVKLAPAVGFSTITCGELAVLTGLRKLKQLATISVLNVALGLVVSIPIYYIWGIDGVLGALVALAFAVMMSTLAFGCIYHRYTLNFHFSKLKKGNILLNVGLSVVISEMIGHLVILGIQSFLNNTASLETVGFYNSNYALTMACAGIAFAAFGSDYFPRLTALTKDIAKRSITIINQMHVTTITVTPLLIALILSLPILVPLLLNDEFIPIVPMAQITSLGLFFRAIHLPNAYVPLAMGDSKLYFTINLIGALDMLIVIPGYIYGGLTGIGFALAAQNFLDMFIVVGVSHWYYKLSLNNKDVLSLFLHFILILTAYIICITLTGYMYWVTGVLTLLLSLIFSYRKFKNESAN